MMADLLFQESELLSAAQATTGLNDFGPEHFREGLSVLITSLSEEAHIKPDMLPVIRERILEQLTKRLRMQDWFNRYPEILDEEVKAPICILGSPRSGSSIMHELLAQDPENRCPAAWEVFNPVPPPETGTYRTDPRIAERQAHFDAIYEALPDMRHMHRMAATLPSEDVEMTSLDFASVVFLVDCYIPTYSRWLFDEVDYTPVYQGLKRHMQLLQWRCPGAPWVLKSLYTMHYMDAFLEVFPDARIIWLHRDPLKALSSGVHLSLYMGQMFSDGVPPVEIARDILDWGAVQFDRAVDIQESKRIAPENLINIKFSDFVQDHVGTVKRIYAHFGNDMTPDTEAVLHRYLAENPADKHGHHRYRFADTGLDVSFYREKVARYQAYFGIENDPNV